MIYCSVDDQLARPILAELEQKLGIEIRAVYDSEAGKTTGLLQRIVAERDRPVADVWWSSEIFGTIDLADARLLQECRIETDLPVGFRDGANRWFAFGGRGRVVAFDPKRTKADDVPQRWSEFADERFRGRVAIADPRFGTTRGHMAAMLHLWGEAEFTAYLESLHRNEVKIGAGNAHTVTLLARGEVEFAWTDTDDVLAAQRRGDSIAMLVPTLDRAATAGSPETAQELWIPNTAARIKHGSNSVTTDNNNVAGDAVERVMSFLCSAECEQQLSASESGNVPVRTGLSRHKGVPKPGLMFNDFAATATKLDLSDAICRRVLLK